MFLLQFYLHRCQPNVIIDNYSCGGKFEITKIFFCCRFRIDKNYVGIPPQLEITIRNLNDNIDKAFLADMMNKVGPYEELTIFYHPLTNRHLGFGRVVFQDVKHSKLCIEKYNGKSVMGQVNTYSQKC